MNRFLEELALIGCYTDHDHHTEYGGETFVTPPPTENDDGKENDGEEAPRATVRTPRT